MSRANAKKRWTALDRALSKAEEPATGGAGRHPRHRRHRRASLDADAKRHEDAGRPPFALLSRARDPSSRWKDRRPESALGTSCFHAPPHRTPGQHGTFIDVIERLPAIRAMGFDVLYFPPIHPIGTTHRKGRNNALTAGPDDPGSCYAIGSPLGRP